MMPQDVCLHVYDLSFGLAQHMSKDLLGIPLEGVWHTGVTVFGYEYFYGKTVQRKRIKQFEDMFGSAPAKKVVLGKTNKSQQQFETFITGKSISKKYNLKEYSMLHNNSSHFCNDIIKFLITDSDAVFTDEVKDILSNSEVIANSPSASLVQALLENASGMISKIFENSSNSGFTMVEHLRTEQEENADVESDAATLSEEDLDKESENQINPEAMIMGFMDIFEGFTGAQEPAERQRRSEIIEDANTERRRPQGGDIVIPPEAGEAAKSFGRNLVEAINLVNASVAAAVAASHEEESASPPPNSRNSSSVALQNLRLKSTANIPEEEKCVPVRSDVREFLAKVFYSTDEEIVQRAVLRIFKKEGYYSLNLLKGVTEEELLQMGVKRGWAKKLKQELDKHFRE